MKPRVDKYARGVGLLLGIFLAAGAVWMWHLPRGNGTLGAQLIVTAQPTGELLVNPPGEFLSAPSMHPAPAMQAQSGQIKVRNITPRTLAIELKGSPVVGTYASFTGTTGNGGNNFSAGTVVIGDNDAGSSVISLSNAKPGDSSTGCIAITYTGSLTASVKLYGSTTGSLAQYLTFTVTR